MSAGRSTTQGSRPAWTIAEAAAWLGVSPKTLYRQHADGELPGAFAVRGRILVSIAQLATAYGLPSPLTTTEQERHQ